jgi:hypothetical protein
MATRVNKIFLRINMFWPTSTTQNYTLKNVKMLFNINL